MNRTIPRLRHDFMETRPISSITQRKEINNSLPIDTGCTLSSLRLKLSSFICTSKGIQGFGSHFFINLGTK